MGERFGSSVVNIGDINKDGYLDVAIGAPGGAFGGSVYIFNGGPDGITSRSELISIASSEVMVIFLFVRSFAKSFTLEILFRTSF